MNWLRLCSKMAGGWEVLYCAYNGLIQNFRQGMNSINVPCPAALAIKSAKYFMKSFEFDSCLLWIPTQYKIRSRIAHTAPKIYRWAREKIIIIATTSKCGTKHHWQWPVWFDARKPIFNEWKQFYNSTRSQTQTHANTHTLAHKSTSTRKWMTWHSKELCDREQTIMSVIISHWWFYCQDTAAHTPHTHTHKHTRTGIRLQYCGKNSIHNKSTAALFDTTIGPCHQLNSFTPSRAIQKKIHYFGTT